jgi:hypothetical protein
MEPLNALYVRLLHVGFIALRQAVDSRNQAWVEAEIEFLHNVPSLIDEPNVERHRYFWFVERRHYVEWANASDRDDVKSAMKAFYLPVLREMEPVLLEFLSAPTA